MKKQIFWIFGILQSISLGTIVFLIFHLLNVIAGEKSIGYDSVIALSIVFPLMLLVTEYVIYSKKE